MMFSDDADLPVMGGCLCNEVSFRVRGKLSPVVASHSQDCRRMSGHYTAFTSVPRENVEIEGDITWYEGNGGVKRGFCPICGSNLFSDEGGAALMIHAGALDKPTGAKLAGHINCAEKGDYYEIEGDLPKADGADADFRTG